MTDIVFEKMISSGIVAVVRKVDPKKVNQLVNSLITGGVSGIEITMDSEKALETINELKDIHNHRVTIGAGTVVNKKQATEAINAGADFIFAPIIDKATIEYTKREDKIMVPGAFTPTEIYQGYLYGADAIKIFPSNVVGPKFIQDVKGPLSEIPLMPTGGISLENIQSYFEVGCIAAGVGGSLVDLKLINNNKWAELEDLARKYVNSASRMKKNRPTKI
ncbi:bifunctional 4-hydroxy-2-oxoglutarate aldolase/2-dehydro-3-deoxy-phosphogluconate aldolase [Gracilibacillus thailandensis]|uniref:Bifunctional 4-hydroxy-2-oxoglutarate aldolase/2-dehydro-3-deoxy-phosphogluconate aldolase n=1 Tax=Gracilibacillus thailandensis TaxID=563735 RepID=A0A6N7QZ11_9BACI|nr:bifunctional 4-hydroxy-2-oxoglutarate aldolase/2-dehydro-3-deoxy-phosphogluconate aldolase [Gracilibacillus thailandensis]MRI66121.1 bifunctional 4-hydroxy-2-oxoglutarate aldolase/2-dehydro-3-deoxy-phosphogluconate aldolase [Gracilibacillus thailandensis]